MAVMAPEPLILVMVLPVVVLLVPVSDKTLTALDPQVQLLNVLFCMVLVEEPPSVFTQPDIVVAPDVVMFEKLLLLLLMTLPEIDVAVVVNKVIVPPAFLVKVPDIELLFTFMLPVPGTITLLLINVTL